MIINLLLTLTNIVCAFACGWVLNNLRTLKSLRTTLDEDKEELDRLSESKDPEKDSLSLATLKGRMEVRSVVFDRMIP